MTTAKKPAAKKAVAKKAVAKKPAAKKAVSKPTPKPVEEPKVVKNEDGVLVPNEADYPEEKDDAPVVTSMDDDEGVH